MAKRKGSRKTQGKAASKGTRRRTTAGRTSAASKSAGRSTAARTGTRRTKAAAAKSGTRKTKSTSRARAAKKTKKAARTTARSTKTTRTTARTAAARRTSTGRASTRTAKAAAKTSKTAKGRSSGRTAAATKRTKPARQAAPAARRKPAAEALRRPPALDRERRSLLDDDQDFRGIVQTPPSTLDLDRTASAVRTGRRGLRDRFDEHTETGPEITGGDLDADWESAYSVGDEAPGGDNPTPDQDIVDDIGRAVGIQYQDNEELKGEEKIASRDRHRWELDPASSEDYDER